MKFKKKIFPGCSSPPSSKQQQQHFRHFNHKEHETAVNSGKYSLFSPPGLAPGGAQQSVISEATTQPRRGATIYTRPRSASIGNRLSDAEQTSEVGDCHGAAGSHGGHGPELDHDHHSHYHHHYRHRRHHTLDSHHQHQGVHHGGHYEDEERHMMSFGGTTTSSRSISSKSEKSSSRSSQSPSVENMRHGELVVNKPLILN